MLPDDKSGLMADASADDTSEMHNSEQDDEQSQAQQVAENAMNLARSPAFPESEHAGHSGINAIAGGDEQDLVDHMKQMERSGRIDMDAYRGERNDDDESGMIGEGGMEPGEIDDNGREIDDEN